MDANRPLSVTAADVEAAAVAIAGHVVRTPSAYSATLSEIYGCDIVVKFENLQFTASFKERGACNRLLALTDAERRAGVVAVSAGNHAQAVARHATRHGVPATIVMPRSTPFVKIARTRHLGAEVELYGENVGEAMERGRELVAEGRAFIHPYDDEAVIAGQGTVGRELLEDRPDLDDIVVPVGGGGLLAGIAAFAHERAPAVRLVGVQASARTGPTLAEGIAVDRVGERPQRLLDVCCPEMLSVDEAAIEEAVGQFAEIEKVVSEGAGAAGLAAVATNRDRFAGRRVGIILSGGNIDPRVLASVLLRSLVHTGRLHRWVVPLADRPGALSRLTATVAEAGGNIIEVVHQRLFTLGPITSTGVELVVETMDEDHARRLVAALRAAGYDPGGPSSS